MGNNMTSERVNSLKNVLLKKLLIDAFVVTTCCKLAEICNDQLQNQLKCTHKNAKMHRLIFI